MIVSVATVGVDGEDCLVRAVVVVEGQATRGKDNAARCWDNSKRWDMSSAAARQAGWLAGAGVEDNNYLPRTPAEGRKREGLDGRPTMGDDE